MKTSKALEFIYQDVKIHFLLSNDENVMVNATEMAKAFNKRVDDFTRLESTISFVNKLSLDFKENYNHADVRDYNLENILNSNKKRGTFMHRILAIKFAAWLDQNFEIWIYKTIDNILFGHYKQHWDAHVKQEQAKTKMEVVKRKLLINPLQEDVIAYFEAENELKNAKSEKLKAIYSQYKLFNVL